jgi:aryl-alcohol dehydrogenase-like predicted oxidoreductase
MESRSSRRNFLAAGLAVPVAGLASVSSRAGDALQSPQPSVPQSKGSLKYRTLGRTGMKVTEVGLGCMITSDQSVVERAADLGINFFDTARGYQGGNNERMVGAALKARRKQVFLSSKTHARTGAEALADLETSLRELGTDYLDVWNLHGRNRPEELTDELLEVQQKARQQGKIRFAGISTHNLADVIPAVIKSGKLDMVIFTYNFTMGDKLDEAIKAGQAAGIGLVAMKVMAGGFRRARPGPPPEGPKGEGAARPPGPPPGPPPSAPFEILKREGAMVAALKWVLRNPGLGTTIPSMTDMEQLDDNFRAMGARFTDTDAKVLAAQLDYIRPLYCRMCGNCQGTCPQGLPVADMLRYLTYAEGYGQFTLGREHFLALPEEVTRVRCRLCPSCAVKCPNGVQVAERLIRAQELFA